MSCSVAGFAKIETGTKINSCSQPGEIVFYFGADEALVLVFDQTSLADFLDIAPGALQLAREKETERAAVA
jgi:hypothetical protein